MLYLPPADHFRDGDATWSLSIPKAEADARRRWAPPPAEGVPARTTTKRSARSWARQVTLSTAASGLVRGRAPAPLRAVGGAYLARPFSSGGPQRRILLVYVNHDLAWCQFSAFLGRGAAAERSQFRAVEYGATLPPALVEKASAVFVQAPYGVDHAELDRVLAGLRRANPAGRIVFFDWAAPTDLRFAAAVAPHVDGYVKKSVLRDRLAYATPTTGHTQLSDHYSARFGVDNPPPSWEQDVSVLARLRAGPAFAADRRLAPQFLRHRAPPAGERPIDLHARLAVAGTPWYAAMRGEAAGRVADLFGDLVVASDGMIGRRRYMREMRGAKLCFSPFGYGEICWRDVEAIAAGAVMVKPDMGHVETWPDIYRAGETYLPVRWDLSDLDEVVRGALANPRRMRRIALNAFTLVREHLLNGEMMRLATELAEPAAV